MKVTIKSVQTIAADAGLPESIIERHLDALCEMVIRAKIQERKSCINSLRNWFHQKGSKPPLHDLIEVLNQSIN